MSEQSTSPTSPLSAAHPAHILASFHQGGGGVPPASMSAGPSASYQMAAPSRSNASGQSRPASNKAAGKRKDSGAAAARAGAGAGGDPQASGDEDDGNPGEDGVVKRRRRVVVACDTCRRKKVKCQGLPNPTSTCNNCAAYNYKCTFSADNDRSRGKYEILETKVETLYNALRSVAPHLADDFSRGQLTMSGSIARSGRQHQDTEPALGSSSSSSRQPAVQSPLSMPAPPRAPGTAPPGPRTGPSLFEMNTMLPPLTHSSQTQVLPPIRKALGGAEPHHRRPGPLVPDLEDGRPRFYGKSSTLSLFHALESRPGSPSRGHDAGEGSSRLKTESATPSDADGRSRGWAVLPQPQPIYPSNSREWVHLIRRKNTVAVGRDDVCTDEWQSRFMLPANDLVFHLLDDIYFPILHPLLPILHPPTFRRDIQSGRANHDTAFRGLVFCVLTISARFSTDPRVLANPEDPHSAGDHWAAGSRLYHQAFAASLINVQVLLLTATFMHASIGPGSAWTVLGLAVRGLFDIGLHQERANAEFKPFDQEMRRRTFWASFILDSIFTICLGRPSALKLEDCNVNLPLDISDEALSRSEATGEPIEASPPGSPDDDKPRVASGFRHMAKLNLLVHEVVSVLYMQRKPHMEWKRHPGLGPTKSEFNGADTNAEASTSSSPRPSSRNGGDQAAANGNEDSAPSAAAATPSSTRRPLPATREELDRLCKLLDEWVAETPAHLKDVSTSPFKLQAGIVSCGTHDIRLYILKPFLVDTVLYRELHPLCIDHARHCLRTVINLYETGQLNNMVFIFMQAFMSSATFLLTVWHVTPNVAKLSDDADLIEQTAKMMSLAFDDRYSSAVFRKAWRVLQRVAMRVMPVMGEQQRARTQNWITRGKAGAEVLLTGVTPGSSAAAVNTASAAPSRAAAAKTPSKSAKRPTSSASSSAASSSLGHGPPAPTNGYSFATGANQGPYPTTSFGFVGGQGGGSSGGGGGGGVPFETPPRPPFSSPSAGMPWQQHQQQQHSIPFSSGSGGRPHTPTSHPAHSHEAWQLGLPPPPPAPGMGPPSARRSYGGETPPMMGSSSSSGGQFPGGWSMRTPGGGPPGHGHSSASSPLALDASTFGDAHSMMSDVQGFMTGGGGSGAMPPPVGTAGRPGTSGGAPLAPEGFLHSFGNGPIPGGIGGGFGGSGDESSDANLFAAANQSMAHDMMLDGSAGGGGGPDSWQEYFWRFLSDADGSGGGSGDVSGHRRND